MVNFQTAKYADVTVAAGNSLALDGFVNMDYKVNINHSLQLAVWSGRYRPVAVENSFAFDCRVNTGYKMRAGHYVLFSVWAGPNVYADAEAELNLTQLLQRTYTEDGSDAIVFSTKLENIPNREDDFGISQQFTVEVIHKKFDELIFSTEATSTGSIFNRTGSSTVNFGSYSVMYSHYKANYTFEGTGGTGTPEEKPGAPIEVVYDITLNEHDIPECHLADCSHKGIIFEYGSSVVSLRSPVTVQKIVNNTIENTNRSGEPLQACIYPMFTVLSLSFSGINRADKDAFNNFIRDTAGLEIIYTDNCGDIWDGVIISESIQIEQDGNGYDCPAGSGSYSFTVDFEGVKR